MRHVLFTEPEVIKAGTQASLVRSADERPRLCGLMINHRMCLRQLHVCIAYATHGHHPDSLFRLNDCRYSCTTTRATRRSRGGRRSGSAAASTGGGTRAPSAPSG